MDVLSGLRRVGNGFGPVPRPLHVPCPQQQQLSIVAHLPSQILCRHTTSRQGVMPVAHCPQPRRFNDDVNGQFEVSPIWTDPRRQTHRGGALLHCRPAQPSTSVRAPVDAQSEVPRWLPGSTHDMLYPCNSTWRHMLVAPHMSDPTCQLRESQRFSAKLSHPPAARTTMGPTSAHHHEI